MATSKPDQTLEAQIEAAASYITKTQAELEERFGLLYLRGKPKELCPLEREKLEDLNKKLLDMKTCIEKFQQDSFEACGIFIDTLKPVKMRPERGRLNAPEGLDADSGIGSRFVPTPKSSSNTLSRGYAENTNRESQPVINDKNKLSCSSKLFDPSMSVQTPNFINNEDNNDACQRTAKTEVTSFYLETPPMSTTSLSNQDDVALKTDTDIDVVCTKDHVTTKELNDLSKPPSEEDNTKHTGV